MILSDPVLRDEFLDARVRVIVDACEHICEVGLGINFGLTAVFDQGEHDGRSGPGIGVSYEPLNFVMIGDIGAVVAAFTRRNFRFSLTSPRYVFGRTHDTSTSKQKRWVPSQPHTVRIWLTNIRFRGDSVWIGQVSMPLGGRFGEKSDGPADLPIDSDVDEARNDIVQDLVYSQFVSKIGFIGGVGRVAAQEPRSTPNGGSFHTDGLRVVLFFVPDPVSLSQIQNLEWERLVDHGRE